MIKYYLLTFFRNIKRQKLFFLINLLGLTAGIVSTLLIYLFVENEFSHDRFHKNASDIYRINQTFIWGDHDDHEFASLGPGVAYALAAEIPEVKEVTRIHPPGNSLVSYTDNKNESHEFEEKGILAVDTNFFKVFTFPLMKGDEATALQNPNSVVISESTAKKYFGDEDPIGKLLQADNFPDQPTITLQVTGVALDPPDNSYIQFDMLMSMNSFPRIKESTWTWMWTMFETFVLLEDHASVDALKSKLPDLPRKYAGKTLERFMNQSFDEYEKSGKKWELFVQPFTDIHLHSSNVYNRIGNSGNITTVYVLMGVEVFIVLLSCINFMNLSTAQYTRRIKESSLRKVLGSNQAQLTLHFFSEAFMFCVLAAIIGLGLTQILLPLFNTFTETNLTLDIVNNQRILLVLLGLIFAMSALSGSYPAIFLSTFPPVEALKGKVRAGRGGKNLRNGLVAFQFIVSMALIVCTIVVFQQLKFLAAKDIGFTRENLMVVNRLEWVSNKEPFVNTLKNIPSVEDASWCTAMPPNLYDGDQFTEEGNDKYVPINYLKADEQYVPTLNLKIKAGRNFSKDTPADKNGVIINEVAAKEFGWKADESVIGKKIYYPGQQLTFEVVGIVNDFNYWSLEMPIQSMAIFHINSVIRSHGGEYASLRITPTQTGTWNEVINAVEKQWNVAAGDAPFQYDFVDQSFAKLVQSEEKFGVALIVFAALAIMIACFGLLGMIIYTLEQRTKEIGIRKVVGASVLNIWTLVFKDYTILIITASVISTPLCIWFLNRWLEDFQYRVSISPWVFIFSTGLMLMGAVIVTGYHVVKAALMNPVDVLKDE